MGVVPVLLQTAHTHLCLLTFIIQIMQRSETCMRFFWFLSIRETGLFCLCGDNICVSVYSVKTSVQSENIYWLLGSSTQHRVSVPEAEALRGPRGTAFTVTIL